MLGDVADSEVHVVAAAGVPLHLPRETNPNDSTLGINNATVSIRLAILVLLSISSFFCRNV